MYQASKIMKKQTGHSYKVASATWLHVHEYESKIWVSVESEVDGPVRGAVGIVTSDAGVQAVEELLAVTSCEAETLTDVNPVNEEEIALKAEEESYRRELEERCAAYQQDLYVMRGELMTIQADADQDEEIRAKFHEDLMTILHSEFITNGYPALSKLKYSTPNSTRECEEVILTALHQLSSLWREIVDQKNALEMAVATQLSGLSQSSPVSSTTGNIVKDLLNEPSLSGHAFESQDFFPQRLDSFGLETILEEDRLERNEEDNKQEELEVANQRSKSSNLEVPLILEQKFYTSMTQTEDPEIDIESLKAEILQNLEAAYMDKERVLREISEKRQAKILRLEAELERLKCHLVDMEDQHTGEMLACEETENGLKSQINLLQSQISRLMQNSEKSAEVKEEISRLESERDFMKDQCISYEDQLQKLGVQLQNLNFVLEQFQKEKDVEIDSIKRQLKSELNALQLINKNLNSELQLEKELLEKAKSGLNAARVLNVQIEEKSRLISTLKTQVQEKETETTKLKAQLDEISNNNVAKIDRYLVKNLLVGYFSTPSDKRKEVLRIIATVLDFNREDRQKTGLEPTSLWPFKSESIASGDGNQSLSQAFIKFLETESQPQPKIKISMEEIARKHSRASSESSNASASSQTPHTEISLTLPVLNQADRSNSILKDVLNPKT